MCDKKTVVETTTMMDKARKFEQAFDAPHTDEFLILPNGQVKVKVGDFEFVAPGGVAAGTSVKIDGKEVGGVIDLDIRAHLGEAIVVMIRRYCLPPRGAEGGDGN